MTIIEDMNSIFLTSRFLGGAVHVTVGDDIEARTRRHVIFIVSSMTLYLGCLVGLCIHALHTDSSNIMSAIFVLTRVAFIYACLFVDAGLTTIWNRKIRTVLAHLRSFDRVTNFDNYAKRRVVRYVCRALSFLTLTCWSITGYLSYRVETGIPILRGIAYAIVDASAFIQILIFVCFSFLISERFHQLCNILTVPLEKGMLLLPNYRPNKRFTLQQIWQLHCTLVNATETLNSVYAVQLLLWISSLSVNAMSRIYTMYAYKLTVAELIRDSIMAVTCTWNLLLITAVCHITARHANRVGEIIFSTSSSVSMNGVFVQENLIRAVAYFQVKKVHFFTVANFLRVDLALLLSILSGVTTYLVIVC